MTMISVNLTPGCFRRGRTQRRPSPGSIDVYDWPGRFVDHGHGEFYARIRRERWQVEHQQIQASATAVGIAPRRNVYSN